MDRIQVLDKQVADLVAAADAQDSSEDEHPNGDTRTPGDVERHVRSMREDDAGSDDDDLDDESDGGHSEDSIEEQFRELEEEVAVLVADVHDLSLFTKLNFTGFVKIVKKHDVSPGRGLGPHVGSTLIRCGRK